jgi:hypothetical protein
MYRWSILLLLFIISCHDDHKRKGVEQAMKQYDHLIKNMDADSIALLYAPGGNLGDVAHGRDSIRKFLLRFKNYTVLSQVSTTSFVKVDGDSSIQQGTYRQVVIVPQNDTVVVKGEFTANWVWLSPGEWHIQKMITKPLK